MKTRDRFSVQVDGQAVAVWVYRRADKRSPRYYAQFCFKGAEFRLSTKESDFKRALIRARELVGETAGAAKATLTPGTLGQLVGQFLQSKYPDETPAAPYALTRRGDKSALKIFEEFAGSALDLTVMESRETRFIIQRFINKRDGEGMTGTTINNNRLALVRFFGWLVGEGRVRYEINPAVKSDLLKVPKNDTQIADSLSREQWDALAAIARRKRCWIGIVLVAKAGLRPIGAERLRWRDVDFEGCVIKSHEKTRDHETAFNQEVRRELRRARRMARKRRARLEAALKPGESLPAVASLGRPGDLIIGHKRDWLTRRVTALMKRAFGKDTRFRLRNLRNSFQQWLRDADVSSEDTAQLAKNSKRMVERIYTHDRPKKLHAQAEKVSWRIVKPAPTLFDDLIESAG